MDSMDCSDPLIHGHLQRLHPGKPAHRLRRCEANVPAELRADGFGAKWDDFMGFPPIFLAKSGGNHGEIQVTLGFGHQISARS